MKSLHLNMYRKINYIAAVLVLLCGITVQAQVTTQSPYSRYGLGNVKGFVLPQLRAMGGISAGVYKPNAYNNINMQNPASYAGIDFTTLDIGATAVFNQLKKGNTTEGSFNGSLSHIALAFPLVRGKSAISFGLLPYTQIGYQFSNAEKIDTTNVNHLYSGEGGLSKAYFGIGQALGQYVRIGANVEYLFGNLVENRSVELDKSASINARLQNKNSVGGISFSYGAQFTIPLSTKSRITLGYSGSSPSKVNSTRTYVATQYTRNSSGEENAAADTIELINGKKTNLKLPLVHNFGFTIQKDNKWVFGGDYRMGNWSKLTIDGENQGLEDSWGFSAGGQYTPDMGAVSGYFKRVDYRVGFTYDKTYIKMKDQDIKQMAVTFGFGLPLASNRNSAYKLNFTTELGKRGTLLNNLVQENYINFHLGFTINDRWFQKFKLD